MFRVGEISSMSSNDNSIFIAFKLASSLRGNLLEEDFDFGVDVMGCTFSSSNRDLFEEIFPFGVDVVVLSLGSLDGNIRDEYFPFGVDVIGLAL